MVLFTATFLLVVSHPVTASVNDITWANYLLWGLFLSVCLSGGAVSNFNSWEWKPIIYVCIIYWSSFNGNLLSCTRQLPLFWTILDAFQRKMLLISWQGKNWGMLVGSNFNPWITLCTQIQDKSNLRWPPKKHVWKRKTIERNKKKKKKNKPHY
jgi:hypothetical protein